MPHFIVIWILLIVVNLAFGLAAWIALGKSQHNVAVLRRSVHEHVHEQD